MNCVREGFPGFGCLSRGFSRVSECGKEARVHSFVPADRRVPSPKLSPRLRNLLEWKNVWEMRGCVVWGCKHKNIPSTVELREYPCVPVGFRRPCPDIPKESQQEEWDWRSWKKSKKEKKRRKFKRSTSSSGSASSSSSSEPSSCKKGKKRERKKKKKKEKKDNKNKKSGKRSRSRSKSP